MEATDNVAVAPTNGATEFLKKQPLLALSGLGAAIGSINSIFRRLKRASNVRILPRLLPIRTKYLRHNYVKYPAIFIVLLLTTRKLRSVLN